MGSFGTWVAHLSQNGIIYQRRSSLRVVLSFLLYKYGRDSVKASVGVSTHLHCGTSLCIFSFILLFSSTLLMIHSVQIFSRTIILYLTMILMESMPSSAPTRWFILDINLGWSVHIPRWSRVCIHQRYWGTRGNVLRSCLRLQLLLLGPTPCVDDVWITPWFIFCSCE